MSHPNAETAYLFRHALLRDAAYQLQIPGARARLHGLALELIEAVTGGPPPPVSDYWGREIRPHPTDSFAAELAEHARLAAGADSTPAIRDMEMTYRWRAARHAEANFRVAEAGECFLRATVIAPDSDARQSATLAAAEMQLQLERATHALSLVNTAMADCRATGNRKGEARCLLVRASVARLQDRHGDAKADTTAALAIMREVGNPGDVGRAAASLAIALLDLFEMERAEQLWREALVMCTESGDMQSAGRITGNLGFLLSKTGRQAQAEEMFRKAQEAAEALGDLHSRAVWIQHRGDLCMAMGRLEEAGALTAEALDLLSRTGDRRNWGHCIGNLGIQRSLTGDFEGALVLLEKALAVSRELADDGGAGLWLGNMSDTLEKLGRTSEAQERLRQAADHSARAGDIRRVAIWRANEAELALKSGAAAEAARQFEGPIEIMARLGDTRMEGYFRCARAVACVAIGDMQSARAEWARGRELARGGAPSHLAAQAAEMSAALVTAGWPALGPGESFPSGP